MAAFDVTADDRDELRDAFRGARPTRPSGLMTGRPYPDRDTAYPPLHAGTLGNPPAAGRPVGHRRGRRVALRRPLRAGATASPRELVKMPFLANDRLDPDRSHGDVLLTISADTPDVNLFALRQLMRRTRGALALHWMVDGFNRRSQPEPGKAPVRNLMGFLDGTANLDAATPT